MKKILVLITLLSLFSFSIYAQKISTQKFAVRKITFTADDQIVPISGVCVEINQANFRSDKTGQFLANIPVSSDNGFYISKISAPGYIVSYPEDLTKKIFLTSNTLVIVLADPNAVKAEKDRIRNNHQVILAKQEEQLKAQVKKNAELLSEIELKDANYKNLLEELEKAKQQLESFKNAKVDIEAKIDSLSENLSMIDYASLGNAEKEQLEKEKQGEWITAIIDEVLSQLEENLSARYDKKISSIEKFLTETSDAYYKKFIEGNTPIVKNYFAYNYSSYLEALLSKNKAKGNKVLDRMLDKVVEEERYSIIDKHVDKCTSKWKVTTPNADYHNDDNDSSVRTLESAKKEFLEQAMYPDRTEAIHRIAIKYWHKKHSLDEEIYNALKKVYRDYYTEGKRLVSLQAENYSASTQEELSKFDDETLRSRLYNDLISASSRNSTTLEPADRTFTTYLNFCIVQEVEEQFRAKYNSDLEKEIEKIEKSNWKSIISKIPTISPDDCYSTEIKWESDKYFENDNQEYAKYKKDYPIYTDFLYSIVMIFMQPIIDKYDSDLALKSRQSDMEDDVHKYCFLAIKWYSNLLSYIPNVPGSNDECLAIMRTIVAVEKEKMVKKHNERIDKDQEAKRNEENAQMAKLKNSAKDGIKSFTCEKDILTFLAIHKFITDDESRASWYDSKISKHYIGFSNNEHWRKISYQIVEWTSNSAKLKIINDQERFVVVKIKLDSTSSSYTESAGGMTIEYNVVAKE